MSDDPIITIADFRRVYCVPGTHRRFVSAGVDFREFVKNGLPVSELKGHGYDAMIDRIIKAKAEAERLDVTNGR